MFNYILINLGFFTNNLNLTSLSSFLHITVTVPDSNVKDDDNALDEQIKALEQELNALNEQNAELTNQIS